MKTLSTPEASPVADQTRWFADEVHAHDAQLKSYLRGAFPSVRDLDDVVQESYLRVWRRQLLRPLACARSFLYTVARNLAIDSLRRKAVSPIEPVSELAGLNVLDGKPDAADAACLPMKSNCCSKLSSHCRGVAVMWSSSASFAGFRHGKLPASSEFPKGRCTFTGPGESAVARPFCANGES